MSYVPDMTGRYTILIKYGGDEIPYSPYRIRAVPTGDASKCTVTGREQPKLAFYVRPYFLFAREYAAFAHLTHAIEDLLPCDY